MNVLLPLLIYFLRNTDKLVEHIYSSNFVALQQILLVTVIALEHNLLEQYDWPNYRIHIHTSRVKNNRPFSKILCKSLFKILNLCYHTRKTCTTKIHATGYSEKMIENFNFIGMVKKCLALKS